MDQVKINWLAVALATLSAFLIGGVWYSKLLFANKWMQLTGMTEEKARSGNMAKIFGTTLILAFISAANLAAFIGASASVSFAVFAGFAAGLGWVATAYGTTYLFEHRPFALWAINAGYHVVTLTVMGLIIGIVR